MCKVYHSAPSSAEIKNEWSYNLDYYITDVTGQRIGSIFKGHESGILTLEDGTDTLSRNVGKQLPHDAA
jgi:hypothetical protein